MGRIPCENARHIEAFTADDAAYVMVANYANFEGQQATTFLYKYRHDQKKFVEHQKFGTQEAADVRYFYIENKEKLKDHFVVVANAMRAEGNIYCIMYNCISFPTSLCNKSLILFLYGYLTKA